MKNLFYLNLVLGASLQEAVDGSKQRYDKPKACLW